jgi:hypothetical protein
VTGSLTTATAAAVVQATSEVASEVFAERLVSVFLLGSLAHGGFSLEVSDIDMGLVLEDPLLPSDATRVSEVKAQVVALGLSLADRLSLFWGSTQSLSSSSLQGRFPPLDRLDLILHGQLLAGRDIVTGLPKPSREELVIGAVQFALETLGKPEEILQVRNPASLAKRGMRHVGKRILFPVRFLYTARTGEVGRVEAAAEHYCRSGGPAAPAVAEAIRWRSEPSTAKVDLIGLLSKYLLPLYLEFVDDHLRRMEGYGELKLAARLRKWREELCASGFSTTV